MSDAGVELRARIREQGKPQAVCELLDGLGEPARVAAALGLARLEQRALWQMVDGFRPVTLADMVPPSVPAMQPVRHFGRNSMPVLTRFEKVFFRAPGEDAAAPHELGGMNVGVTRPIAGPGYYMSFEDRARGEVRVDYTRLPTAVPEGWPEVTSNERGIARLVYGFMVDTLRRVSEHVTIGRAARHGRDMGAYFVLCRQELP